MPRETLDQALPAPGDLHGLILRGDSGMGGLLGDYMRSLVARADDITMAEAPLVAQATTDMIVACFQSTAETAERARTAIDKTMRQRIQRHIAAHLESPALHAEALCAQFRISRSQLYRLFEPLGGVAHYIQEQRLARACAELGNPAHDHRRIYEIAFALGFSSEAHFSRVFRSTFGLSPSDVRARAQAARVDATPAGVDRPTPTAATRTGCASSSESPQGSMRLPSLVRWMAMTTSWKSLSPLALAQVLEADQQLVAARRHAGQDLFGPAGIERGEGMEDRGAGQDAERGALQEHRQAAVDIGRLAVRRHEGEVVRQVAELVEAVLDQEEADAPRRRPACRD